MELWLAALLLIVFSGVFLALLLFSSRKKTRFIVAFCILGSILLLLISYISLTFLFLNRSSF